MPPESAPPPLSRQIEGHLSQRAQLVVPTAMVYRYFGAPTETGERFVLELEAEAIGLGHTFGDAKLALSAWVNLQRRIAQTAP